MAARAAGQAFVAISLLGAAPASEAQMFAEVNGYRIFRHDDRGACSASLFTPTSIARDANITYWRFDDGRPDEVYFGLRPFEGEQSLFGKDRHLSISVDEDGIFAGMVPFGSGGFVGVPVTAAFVFVVISGQGDRARLRFLDPDEEFVFDLNDLRGAKDKLLDCLEGGEPVS